MLNGMVVKQLAIHWRMFNFEANFSASLPLRDLKKHSKTVQVSLATLNILQKQAECPAIHDLFMFYCDNSTRLELNDNEPAYVVNILIEELLNAVR